MRCSKCQKEKDISKFALRPETKKGRRGVCYDCANKRSRELYQKNRKARLKYAHKWYANHRENIIKQRVYSNLKARRLARLDCIEHYSKGKNCCNCCGEKHLEFLAIDHIHGGGNKHRKTLKEYLPLILKRQNYPKGYRVLCHNCNNSIGFYGYCPHQKKKYT